MERFSTKVDVGVSLGLEYVHPYLLDWQTDNDIAGKMKFDECTDDEKKQVREACQEHMVTYAMLQQSGKHAAKLRSDTRVDYLRHLGDYPANRTELLDLLDRYSKTPMRPVITSEGKSFCTRGW